MHPPDDDARMSTFRRRRPLHATVRDDLPGDWIALHDALPDRPRHVRLRLPTYVLIGPPGVVCLQDASIFTWERGQWWNAGHETIGLWEGARRGEDDVRELLAGPARDLGGPDVVLGHAIVFAPGGRPADAPGDTFVTHDPARDDETFAAFVDRIVARGRVARRIDRRAFSRRAVRRIAAVLDPTVTRR